MSKLAKQKNKNKLQLPDTSAIERLHFKRPKQESSSKGRKKKVSTSQVFAKSNTGIEGKK